MTIHIDLDWKDHPTRRRGLYTSHLQSDGFFKLEILDTAYDFGVMYPFVKDGKTRAPYYDKKCAESDPRRVAIEIGKDYAGASSKFFDQHVLKRLLHQTAREPLLRGTLSFDPETLDPTFTMRPDGDFKLWVPLVKGRPPADRRYTVGGDPSGGVGKNPASLSVLERDTGEQVASFSSPNIKPPSFGRLLIAVCKFFKGTDSDGAWLCWETNGVGGAVTSVIKEFHYGHIYRRVVKEEMGTKWTKKIGWHSGPGDKSEILGNINGGGLRGALDTGRVIVRDEETLKEANNFVNDKGKVYHARSRNSDDVGEQGEAHGDSVIGLACAWLGCPNARKGKPEEEADVSAAEKELAAPIGSVNWYIEQSRLANLPPVEEFVWT